MAWGGTRVARHTPSPLCSTQDIGKGRYQYYAFLARPPGSAESEAQPEEPDGAKKKRIQWSKSDAERAKQGISVEVTEARGGSRLRKRK